MKAQELMIGDFVKVAKDKICIEKGTIVRVSSIDGDAILEEKGLKGGAHCVSIDDRILSGGVWVEYLEPIPLTPEILEKNGFILNEDGWYCWDRYGVCDGNEYISIAFGDGGNSIYDMSILKGFENMDLHRNFLHELQHALWLCGIEKEIVL